MGFVRGRAFDGVDLIKDGQTYVYDAKQDRFIPADLPIGSLLTAVVDIGPTTNNGPGDQTKGIRNWSASPIVIVAAPGVNKYIRMLDFVYQYLPKTTAYLDPHTQMPGFMTPDRSDFVAVDTGSLGLIALLPASSIVFPSLNTVWSFFGSSFGGVLTSVNKPMTWGDTAAVGELTTGDGQVRITVHYTIDDILT